MKKIIESCAVIMLAAMLFFSTNQTNDADATLLSMIGESTASAACDEPPPCSEVCRGSAMFYCTLTCETTTITCPNSFPKDPPRD